MRIEGSRRPGTRYPTSRPVRRGAVLRRALAGTAAVMLAAAACGGGGSGESDGKKIFSVANSEPDHLTPGRTTSSYSFDVIGALFEGLVTLDPRSGEPVNDEAASITSKDQQHWTIKIKSGLKFHNGEPVTAQSYVDAWNATADGSNGWASNYYFANIAGYDALNPDNGKPKVHKLSGLKVVDAHTFTVKLTGPFSQFPLTLAYPGFFPMPKAAFKDLKAYDEHPIGNGPFMMDGEWEHNKQITLKKFDGYKGSHPAHADGILYKIYANREAAYTDLRAGAVDILLTLPASKLANAKKTLGKRLVSLPSGTMDFLGFPIWDERFADVNLRRAFSMAIDRKGIVDAVYNGTYKPSGSLLAQIIPGYRDNPCGQYCTYNPTKAKQLFEKAGGFSGTLYLALSNADPTYKQWMTAVANQLKQNLGIKDVKLQVIPVADYLDSVKKHEVKGPWRKNWVMDYPSPQNFLGPIYGKGNRLGYYNKKFEKLLDKGDAAPNMQKSIPFYQQAEDVVLNDMPATPLWNWQDLEAYSTNVTNVHFDPYVAWSVHLDQVEVK